MNEPGIDLLARRLRGVSSRRGMVRMLAVLLTAGGPLQSVADRGEGREKRRHRGGHSQVNVEKRKKKGKGKNKNVCKGGTTRCGNTCVNLRGDRRNCGACGRGCGVSEVCDYGACVAGCTVCASGCSFDSVKAAVETGPEGVPILVAPGTYDADVLVDRDVTIRRCGDGGEVVLRNATLGSSAFTIRPEVAATFEHLIISRNPALPFGGGVENDGELVLAHCRLHDNVRDLNADTTGGAAIDNRGTLDLDDCTVSGNAPFGVLNRGVARLKHSVLRNNDGCPVDHALGEMTLTDCSIQDNNGSGISIRVGTAVLDRCVIERNTGHQGGGMYAEGLAAITLSHCQIRDNTAAYTGGIFATQSVSLVVDSCEISGNSAQTDGGGLGVGNARLTNCEIFDNSVKHNGGGLSFSGTALTLDGCTIRDNVAGTATDPMFANGGGIYAAWGEATLTGCTISGNRSYNDGGGIRSLDRLTLDGCTIRDNVAPDAGGGLLVEGGILTFQSGDGNRVSDNEARNGGGLYIRHGAVVCNACTLQGNSASVGGGGAAIDSSGSLTFGPGGANSVRENTAGGNAGGILAYVGASLTLNDTEVVSNTPNNCVGNQIAGCVE